jgi:hypothetical protein
MTFGGFNAAVAAAHGYKIITGADGKQRSVLANLSNAEALARPGNTVPGDCGSSTMTIAPRGGYEANVATGFILTSGPAVDFQWYTSYSDDYGNSTHNWSGGLLLRTTWTGTFVYKSGGPGWVYGTVDIGPSYAILADGEICYSGGPSAYADIY